MPIPFQPIALNAGLEQMPDSSSALMRAMQFRQMQDANQLRALQMQNERMDNQQKTLTLADLVRKQKDEETMRAGTTAAYKPQQVTSNSGPLTMHGMTLPGGFDQTAVGPSTINRNALTDYLGANGAAHMIPGLQTQWATQDLASQKAQLEFQKMHGDMTKTQLENAASSHALTAQLAAPIDMAEKAGAPIEKLQQMYNDGLVQAARLGVDVSQAPKQYTPGLAGQLVSVGMKAHEYVQSQLDKYKAEHPSQSFEEQAAADWLKKNPGKTLSDFVTWKAHQSPTAMMMGNLNLTPEATALAANLYSQTGQLPAGFGRSPQVTANVINTAAKNNPELDIAANKVAYQGKKSTTSYFTSGAGGKQLTAFNTAITHLDTLQRLAGDLNNGNVQVFNRAAQSWSAATGEPAPANFAAAVNAMSGEVAAALKASGATDQEITHVSATFDRAQSPAQLNGAISTYRELLKSKAQQLQKQYEAGMQGKPAFGAAGVQVTDPRGVVHNFPNQAAADQFKQAAGIQ